MIVVDTGPLVALCDRRDRRHRTALVHLSRLAPAGLRTCDAVLTETCFHLPHRMQRERLKSIVQELGIESLPTHESHFRADVFDWLLKYDDHEPDWADACLVVLNGHHPGLKVWTYDREFQTTWRRPDGRAVTLAVRP